MAFRLRPALSTFLLSTALCLSRPALAEETQASPAQQRVYTFSDFARSAPRTALDMLSQVPGFTIRYPGGDRGLGQATENVLLNGQRVTNKSGGATGELQKISAKQVERIEIIDAATLDIAGLSGQVANVVTSASNQGSGQFAWYPSAAAHYGKPDYAQGSISYAGKSGRVSYSVGAEVGGYQAGNGGPTIVYDAADKPIERREEVSRTDNDYPKASASVTVAGPVSASAHVNYRGDRGRSLTVGDRRPANGPVERRSNSDRFATDSLELSGDLSFPLLGGKLKLISLRNVDDSPSNESIGTSAIGGMVTAARVVTASRQKEAVARAEFGWKWSGTDLQISTEAAYNRLDGTSRLFSLDNEGAFVEQPFPGATLQVAEDRYEMIATLGRPLAKGLTLQLVIGGEHSVLSAGTVSRGFLRYKGSASLAWAPDARTDVSIRLARVVEQLNFFQFLAGINLIDNRQSASNTSLVPPQSWKVEGEATRKLGRWGSTRLKLYSQRTEDIIETIPLADGGEAQGNLSHGWLQGLEWQSTIMLDPLGLIGARIESTLELAHSRVRDPTTGIGRPISYGLRSGINVGFRHDIPSSDWAWGTSLNSYAYAPGFDPREVSRSWNGPLDVYAYVENKDILGLKMRVSVSNIADARNRRSRIVHDGLRTHPKLFREARDRLVGPTFSLLVGGNF